MRQSTYLQCVQVTPQQVSHIQQTPRQQIPQQASYTQQPPIVPQQQNYTIHATQVATTSRAITPVASFSETEESNKSEDNDDRLSWQEVKGRGKKRTSSKTKRAPTLENSKSQETSNNPTQPLTV
jgi:hypothetical protein